MFEKEQLHLHEPHLTLSYEWICSCQDGRFSNGKKKKTERKKKGGKPQNKFNRKLFFRSITVSVGSENG